MSRSHKTPLSSVSGSDASPGFVPGPDPVQLLSQSVCVSLGFTQLRPQLLHRVFVLQDVCVFRLERDPVELVHRFLTHTHTQRYTLDL